MYSQLVVVNTIKTVIVNYYAHVDLPKLLQVPTEYCNAIIIPTDTIIAGQWTWIATLEWEDETVKY